MHILLQLLGRLLILVTMLFGCYDLYRHFQSGGPWLSNVGQFWSEMHPASLSGAQAFFEPHLGMDLWISLLGMPMILVIGTTGFVLLLTGVGLRLRTIRS